MISVCVATYNGEQYIEEQLRSILVQLSENDEIIVSDDMSEDNTVSIIKHINDSRIKLYVNNRVDDENDNLPHVFRLVQRIKNNFFNALKHAKGDIIFLSDQDDKWYPNKVESVVKELTGTVVCVIHDARVVNTEGDVLYESFLNFYRPYAGRLSCLIKSPFMGCCMAVKHEVVDKALPIPSDPLEYDTWLGVNAFAVGKIKILDKVLIDYRRHGGNASNLTSQNENSMKIKLQRRYYIIKNLIIK